jgi:hypothetical protein
MKRIVTSTLILGLFAFSTAGLVGCGDTSKETSEVKTEGPGGSTTQKTETSTTVKGDGGASPAAPK